MVNCVPESPASQNIWAITPMPAIVRRGGLRLGRHIPANSDLTAPKRGLTAPRRGLTDSKLWGLALYGDPVRDLPADDIAIKRGELHH